MKSSLALMGSANEPIAPNTPRARDVIAAPTFVDKDWQVGRLRPDHSHFDAAIAHHDGSLIASDGAKIAFRATAPAMPPKALLILQMGTLGKPEYFDELGESLAKKGIVSFAVEPRSVGGGYRQHARDLDAVVRLASLQYPSAPKTVGGVSLGAVIALHWNARHNLEATPVVALSPVIMPKFLGPFEMAKAIASTFSRRIGKTRVNTPMSKRIPLTSNPQSPEWRFAHPETMKVPASLFGDVLKMNGEIAIRGGKLQAPLFLAIAGDDRVAANFATKLFARTNRSTQKAVVVFPGLAHDLTQEWHNPRFVQLLSKFLLPR